MCPGVVEGLLYVLLHQSSSLLSFSSFFLTGLTGASITRPPELRPLGDFGGGEVWEDKLVSGGVEGCVLR